MGTSNKENIIDKAIDKTVETAVFAVKEISESKKLRKAGRLTLNLSISLIVLFAVLFFIDVASGAIR